MPCAVNARSKPSYPTATTRCASIVARNGTCSTASLILLLLHALCVGDSGNTLTPSILILKIEPSTLSISTVRDAAGADASHNTDANANALSTAASSAKVHMKMQGIPKSVSTHGSYRILSGSRITLACTGLVNALNKSQTLSNKPFSNFQYKQSRRRHTQSIDDHGA